MSELDWAQKYRPSTIDEVILPSDIKNKLNKIVTEKGGISLLLWGRPGCGKTTVAQMINPDNTFQINCAIHRSINMVREIEKNGSCFTAAGERKLVILDEAENLLKDAQIALRGVIEEISITTDVVMTANDPNKITPALRSRCLPIHFDLTSDVECRSMARLRLLEIARLEGKLNYEAEIDKALEENFPDMRRMIKRLQFNLN